MENLNKTWKISIIVLRSLLGFLFCFGSVAYFLKFFPEPELSGNIKVIMEGFKATYYILPIIKTVELICGLCFLSGRFITLANVVIFPISLNIFLIHLVHMRDGLPIGIFVFVTNLVLVYVYRENYRALLKAK